MNSLAKFAASQSHRASRRLLIFQSFSTSPTSKRLPKSQKPYSDSKSPPPPPKEWPKPTKIPYQSKVSNSLTLSGYIHMPVQFQAAPDGRFWAGTVISQNPSSGSPPLWIPIIFEGDLAHVAACYLKENDHVYIDGELSADPPSSDATHNQPNVQVMVRAINFVDDTPPKTKTIASPKEEMTFSHSGEARLDDTPPKTKTIASPEEEMTFSHSGEARLDDTPPETKTIASPKEERTFSHSANTKKGTEIVANTWRDFLDNPKEWRDYREQKLNGSVKPRYPDFKSKDGVHSLWLCSAPKSVVPELEALGFDVPNVNQHKGKMNSYSKIEKVHQSSQTTIQSKAKGEGSWKDLVENPNMWWDNRLNKINGKVKEKYPDFKHKETGEALWISSLPTWVDSKLPPLASKKWL